MASEFDKWEWQDLFASKYGPPDPSTRLVLFVILMHIYQGKKSAFPSQDRIAEYSGLSTKSVRRHLESATNSGWLKRKKNQRRGKVGIWYEYYPTIPAKIRNRVSRPDTLSHREQLRPDNLSLRPDNLSTTTGHPVPIDGTPCPPNQVLNQVSKQVLNQERPKNVVNEFPGVEWAEAIAAGKEVGARDPMRHESAKHYMQLVKRLRDKKPPKHISDYIAPVIR